MYRDLIVYLSVVFFFDIRAFSRNDQTVMA